MLFPDYTAAIQQQRSSFLGIKRKLRELDLKYALLFPARLRVSINGKTHFFDSPVEAWSWVERYTPAALTGPVDDWQRTSHKKRRPAARRGGIDRLGPSRSPSIRQQTIDRRSALQSAVEFTSAAEESPTTPLKSSSDTESSVSHHSLHSLSLGPRVTPQTADDILYLLPCFQYLELSKKIYHCFI